MIRVPKAVRNALISTLVLLLLFVGSGGVYVWYSGQNTDQNLAVVAQPVAKMPAEPVLTPPKPTKSTVIGASVQSATSPVTPGSNSSVTVRTVPGAACKIEVLYNKVPSSDSGLAAKTADNYGMITWTWTVGSNTPLGTWPANVTCAFNNRTAFVRADIVVAKTVAPTE